MLDLNQFVAGGMTVGMRMSALLMFTPFPGGAAVPVQIKAAMAMTLTALLYPVYGTGAAGAQSITAENFVGIAANEMAIGALLGLSMAFIFDAAQLAGQSMGLQVGFSLVNIIDPNTQVETPVLATLHQTIVLLIFLQLNVHHWLLRGAAKSFEYLPSTSFHLTGAVVERLLHAAGGVFLVGVQIAAPILLATMMADFTLGFISKASQQLQVLFLGLSIKTVLALVVWMGALAFWPGRFEGYFAQAIGMGEELLHLAK